MKGASFNYARKEAVTECWGCNQVMCTDCQSSSQKELKNDSLAVYGLTICQSCIKIRRLTMVHKEYWEIANAELEKLKNNMRKGIYHLTQLKYASSDRHL